MTIKEIAELTGKNKSTVGRWVEKSKLQNATDKLQNATKNNPIDFTLEETLAILKAGKVSKSLISLLRENAKKKSGHIQPIQPIQSIQNMQVMNPEFENFIGKIIEKCVSETIKQIMPLIKQNQKQIEHKSTEDKAKENIEIKQQERVILDRRKENNNNKIKKQIEELEIKVQNCFNCNGRKYIEKINKTTKESYYVDCINCRSLRDKIEEIEQKLI